MEKKGCGKRRKRSKFLCKDNIHHRKMVKGLLAALLALGVGGK